MSTQWDNPRNLSQRIVVTGWLTLETPAHFGNGDSDGMLDMPLYLDALEGRALLTGTSLAGALRNYLFRANRTLAIQLFGETNNEKEQETSEESLVIIDDALGDKPQIEVRDGVALDPATGIATDEMKYDIELLAAGSRFPLSLELQLRQNDRPEKRTFLLRGFALALNGLAEGEIRLGKRKRRGFGQCRVTDWQVRVFDMTTPRGIVEWLRYTPTAINVPVGERRSIYELLHVTPLVAAQAACKVEATFRIDGSLLVRSTPIDLNAPDAVHLQSWREGKQRPVLSGTSVAGALRTQALRIANTLGKDGYQMVDALFGYRNKNKNDDHALSASRIWVDETEIDQPLSLVQQRVKIDRFTGGAYPGALFAEEPVFGQAETRAHIRFRLDAANSDRQTAAEIGLVLLLLKDLWTGDLPLGGERSIGRGRLAGEQATVTIGSNAWTIQRDGKEGLQFQGSDPDTLEGYVAAFVEYVPNEGASG
ncbi:MAG: RAMP superfamily CRISPR-associated protein [Caldilineaceae bacterium]